MGLMVCAAVSLAGAVICGCGTSYSWRSSVPADARTVSVATFRNESDVSEIGAVATRQLLREFQREGTFSIRPDGDAALEVQGVVKSFGAGVSAYDRRSGSRVAVFEPRAAVEITVIDKRNRRVLISNRRYDVRTTYSGGQDMTIVVRSSLGPLMDELSRQVVDDVLNLKL